MLGCSSVAAVEEVAGGGSVDIIGLHAYGRVLLRVGRGGGRCVTRVQGFGGAAHGDGMCCRGDTQTPEKVCGKGCS